ncbi:uncharacterized protein LOC134287803 isoform X2 [Aedes albopictus]|uniref:Endonuclease/exonuclease/phosphatase domain-containing protein n=1 Tax=Aedes albopictus TaxID=7160 RepID=A0ABM1XYB7_AEDAL
MEAPTPPATVEPIPPAFNSRPGPVCGNGGGVFQPSTHGKYDVIANSPAPDPPSGFSGNLRDLQPLSCRTPGRNDDSSMKAPTPPATVEPIPPAFNSRPGPVCGNGRGVFQPSTHGNGYFCGFQPPRSEVPECYDASSIATSNFPLVERMDNDSSQHDNAFLSIYYQNVRGLRTKTTDLKLRLSSSDYDVIIFTETWLRPDINDSELTSDYSIFRCDRSAATSDLSRGGGVLVAVKCGLQCSAVSLVDCEHLEQVAVRVRLPNRSLYVCNVYLRPCSEAALYSAHAMAAQRIADQAADIDVILILGDYNLPRLKWCFDDDINGYLSLNASSEPELILVDSLSSCGLVQLNPFVNSSGNVLDLVFSNSPNDFEVLQSPHPILTSDDYHPPLVLQLDTRSSVLAQVVSESSTPELDFKRCNYEHLNTILASVDWEHYLNGCSVDANVFMFYDKLTEILASHVPRRRSLDALKKHPWWTTELRNLRNRLRKVRHRFFSDKSNENIEMLRSVESAYNELLTSTYQGYVSRLESNLKRNPTMFWKYVKSQRSGNRVPLNVTYGDVTANTPEEAANLFSSFFQSVYRATAPQLRPGCFSQVPSYNVDLPPCNFSYDDVLRALTMLDASKGAGVDDLPPLLLKNCARSLVVPVMLLFNRSLEEKTFSSLWKIAFMIPIHKTGTLSHVENYRGISILCCLGKVSKL